MKPDIEVWSGLHSCKPGNEPIVGQTKTFTVEQKTSKTGKPWLKIKAAPADKGGQPYRILSAEPTGYTDDYGNVSFNIELEKDLGGGGENTQKPVQAASSSSQNFNGLDERQRAIIRQHSQSSAIEVLKLKQMLGELTIEDLTPAKIKQLATFFDADVFEAIENG